jgi:hypothetical protein
MSQSQCGVLDGEIFALDQNGLLALNRIVRVTRWRLGDCLLCFRRSINHPRRLRDNEFSKSVTSLISLIPRYLTSQICTD